MARLFSHNYVVWAMFITTCVPAFSQSLNTTTPKWKNEELAGGTKPVLAFIPVPDNKESTLIWLKNRNYKQFEENIMTFLGVYYKQNETEKENSTIQHCSNTHLPSPNKVCSVDVNLWGPCNRDAHFQYHRNAPCVFFKLHTAEGWMPEYYNDPNDLPADMPQTLKNRIALIQEPERNKVWITCSGENPVDIEYMGPITYYPDQGFPSYYYPNKKSKGYLSPVIAVHFERPSYGVVTNIECRAWAKNIKYNKTDGSGYVHFELLLE